MIHIPYIILSLLLLFVNTQANVVVLTNTTKGQITCIGKYCNLQPTSIVCTYTEESYYCNGVDMGGHVRFNHVKLNCTNGCRVEISMVDISDYVNAATYIVIGIIMTIGCVILFITHKNSDDCINTTQTPPIRSYIHVNDAFQGVSVIR